VLKDNKELNDKIKHQYIIGKNNVDMIEKLDKENLKMQNERNKLLMSIQQFDLDVKKAYSQTESIKEVLKDTNFKYENYENKILR